MDFFLVFTGTMRTLRAYPVHTGTNHSLHWSRPCIGRNTWSDTRERLTCVQLYWTWPGTCTSC